MTFNDYNDFANSLPDDALLGNLVWFTITKADVPFDTVKQDLASYSLQPIGVRDNIRPVDSFKKATNTVATNLGRTAPGVDSSILVRQVGQDSEMSHRHIMLERAEYKSGKKRRLVYEQVGEIIFQRGKKKKGTYEGYSIKATRLNRPDINFSPEEEEWLSTAISNVEDVFEHEMSHLDSHAVRTIVREYLESLDSVMVRPSGGVYFIPQAHVTELRNLQRWVSSIGSSMDLTPLVNFGESRDMLTSAVCDEALREVDVIRAEIGKILNNESRTVRDSTLDKYASAFSDFKSKFKGYKSILSDQMDDVDTAIEVFGKQILALSDRVDDTDNKKMSA